MSKYNIEFDGNLLGFAVGISLFLFILRIGGLISWSYWIVFLPVLLVLGIIFLTIFFIGLFVILVVLYQDNKSESNTEKDDENPEVKEEDE